MYERPECATHRLVWQGAWFTVADASTWLLDGADHGDLTARGAGAAHNLSALALAAAGDAPPQLPTWAADPISAAFWAWGWVEDEDLCLLGLVGVTNRA